MISLTLDIVGLPHCPRNRSHTIIRKGKASFLGKTEAARMYEQAIVQELKNYSEQCLNFAANFNPKTQHLIAYWAIYSPDTLTVGGSYSRNGTDLDAHKVAQDTIMKYVGIDDAYISTDIRTKVQGDFRIKLTLRIEDNSDKGEDLL